MATLKITQSILHSSVHHTQEQGSAAGNAGLKATLLVLTSAFWSQRQSYIYLCKPGVPASVRSLSTFLCSSSKMRFHIFLRLKESYLSSNTATKTLHAQVQTGHHSFLQAWTPFMLLPKQSGVHDANSHLSDHRTWLFRCSTNCYLSLFGEVLRTQMQ